MAVAAILAAQQAGRENEQCKLYMEGFEHSGATTQEIHTYTECANVLYPRHDNTESTLLGKGVVLTLFVAVIVGAIYGWKENKTEGMFFWCFMGPILALCAMGLLGAMCVGVVFLLS